MIAERVYDDIDKRVYDGIDKNNPPTSEGAGVYEIVV